MSKGKKSLKYLIREGPVSFISKSVEHIQYKTGSFLKGGISSRPQVRRVGGVLNPIYNSVFRMTYKKGTDVMSEDWDNLIILDACRYDDFKKINFIEGNLGHRISKGSDSKEFIKKSFSGRELFDTVYISANPHISSVSSGVFHAAVDDPLEDWNEEYDCVKPGTVTRHALSAYDSFPNKRLIIHYMQPHDPPIGSKAEEFNQRNVELSGPNTNGWDQDGSRIMEAVAAGSLSVDEARQAYRENLEIVLEEVQDLLEQLDGKSVITADHGEMFGEKPYPILGKLYEHYRHPHTENLCRVPWHIPNFDTRREVTTGPPVESKDIAAEEIEQQLKSLGYK